MDLRFAAEEGEWGDDDDDAEVEEVQAEAETPAVHKVIIPATSSVLPSVKHAAKDAGHTDVPARVTRPPSKIHMDPHTRYFVMKSSSHKNIVLSIEHRVWATPRSNQEKLNEAFRSASHVIMVFSVTGSGCFQGYAKMLGPVGSSSTDVFQGFGRAFEVRWLRLDDLDFEQVANIRNPWNENKSVKVSRDGQELPNDVGRQLCDTIDAKVYEGDPSGYIDDSQELETGDPSLRAPRSKVQPLHALHPLQSVPQMQHVAMQPLAMPPMHWAPHAAHVPPEAMPHLVSQMPVPDPRGAPGQWFMQQPDGPDRSDRSGRRKRRRSSDSTPSAPPSDWQGSAPSMVPSMVPSAPSAPRSAQTPQTAPQTWLGASPR